MNKNQLLIPSLRFKVFDGEWMETLIKNVLNYEQPSKYIVKSEKYIDDKNMIPVLTAGKTFILGYTNEKNNIYNKGEVIIFDDFTTDIRYINFDFKIKSSAIKLLTSKEQNLFFIYNSLQNKKIKPLGHNRHYINFIQNYNIFIPSILEQQKIAKFFSLLDKQIELYEKKLNNYYLIYKHYLNKMFANNNKIPSLRFKGFDDELINKKIKEFGNIICGKTPSTNENKFWNGDIPFITPTDINYKYIEHTSRYITNLGSKHSKLIPPNSILVTCVASIGKNAINKLESCFNQQINAIVPNNNYDYEFLYYLMDKNVDLIKENSSKSATQMINKINFENLEIFIPIQLEEQQKIASFFDKLDQLREKTKQTIINLNNQKKYYLKNMFV